MTKLRQALQILKEDAAWLDNPEFPVFVPRSFLSKMRVGDPADPLLRQIAPALEEQREIAGYTNDPLHERSAQANPGVLRKYEGRALLILTGACAVNCRYCFRRHYSYPTSSGAQFDELLQPIRADSSVQEVILSGGDPLILDDVAIATLLERIAAISHVLRVRIHTRLPVVIPRRVTRGLLSTLEECNLDTAVVLHFNHPAELDDETSLATRALSRSVGALLNQGVLLNGVNDTATILVQLSQKLFSAGVLPYYLHLPDKVAGTAHFDVPLERALQLFRDLQNRLPGYLVPRLAREVPGAGSKELLFADGGLD